MAKKYFIEWSEPVYKPDEKEVSENFISEDNGFSAEDVKKIKRTQLGEIVTLDCVDIIRTK